MALLKRFHADVILYSRSIHARQVERFSGLRPVSDMNEFAHHCPNNKLGRLSSRRKTVAEKLSPIGFIKVAMAGM